MSKYCLALFGILWFLACSPSQRLPSVLEEVSGCYLAQADSIWWLTDGGNAASLYCTNKNGRIVETRPLPLPNVDWEAMCADPSGRYWYIGDFGNNCNCRKDLVIYRYDSQNGHIDSLPFIFPDQTAFPPALKAQWNFDCEAMVYFQDSIHIFSKNRFDSNHFAKHYVLPSKAATALIAPIRATLKDSFYLKNGVVTDAAVLPSSNKIALLTYWGDKSGLIPKSKGYIYTIQADKQGDKVLGRQKLRKFLVIRQYETIDVEQNGRYLLSNEKFLWTKNKMRHVRRKR